MSCNGPYLCQVELDRRNGVATVTVKDVSGPTGQQANGRPKEDRRAVGTPMLSATLGELPETDGAHVMWAVSLVAILDTISNAIAQHREALLLQGNFHMDTVAGLDESAVEVHEAGHAVAEHAKAYQRTYAGVRETAQQTEGKIPGVVPGSTYWSETSN
jgi:hypothetical protein